MDIYLGSATSMLELPHYVFVVHTKNTDAGKLCVVMLANNAASYLSNQPNQHDHRSSSSSSSSHDWRLLQASID